MKGVLIPMEVLCEILCRCGSWIHLRCNAGEPCHSAGTAWNPQERRLRSVRDEVLQGEAGAKVFNVSSLHRLHADFNVFCFWCVHVFDVSVRLMENEAGAEVQEAGPSIACQVTGFQDSPQAPRGLRRDESTWELRNIFNSCINFCVCTVEICALK